MPGISRIVAIEAKPSAIPHPSDIRVTTAASTVVENQTTRIGSTMRYPVAGAAANPNRRPRKLVLPNLNCCALTKSHGPAASSTAIDANPAAGENSNPHE